MAIKSIFAILAAVAFTGVGCGGCSRAQADSAYDRIRAQVAEMKRAQALPAGDDRTAAMTKFLNEDYPSLICAETTAYIESHATSDKNAAVVKQIHGIANGALGGNPCKAQPPTGEFSVEDFKARLGRLSPMLEGLKSLSLPK